MMKSPEAKKFKLTLKQDGEKLELRLPKREVNLTSGNFKYDIRPRV